MRARYRALDWAATPLGAVDKWPAALRTGVRLMLDAPVATCLWCGPDSVLLYNEAYARILGAKHPAALGRPGAEVWDELWPALEPQFAQVCAGGPAVYADETLLRMERLEGGAAEDAWFTYALSALTDETGACLAVYNVAVEVTEKVRAREAVAGERTRLFHAFQRVPSFVGVVTGPEHVLEYANEAYYALMGRRDIVGRPVWEALPDARGQGFEILLDSVRDTGTPVAGREVSLRLVRTPGGEPEERFVDFVYQALTDADGVQWGVMAYGSDVTEHVRARREVERLLGESELANQTLQDQTAELEAQTAELQAVAVELEERTEQAEVERARATGILETMADAHFVLDADFRFISVNAASERTLAHSRSQLLGRRIWEAFPGTVGTIFERSYRRVVAERVEVHFIGEYDDGTLALVPEVDAYPASGGGVAVFWRDIAPRVRAEAALRASEQRLRDVFEQAPVAVAVMTGPEHVYTAVSPMYARTPGLGRQLLGRSMRDAFPEVVGKGPIEAMDHVYHTGIPYSDTERLVALTRPEDGVSEDRFFNLGYQPLRDPSGTVYAVASVAYDVTEHVRARREVETARAEAEAANAAKSEFLSTMSHELRTPLNAISGYTELLTLELRGPITEMQRQDLERIRRANHHLMGLVTDVLNFARLDAGQVEFHVADVELASVVGDLEPLVGPQLAAKQLIFDHAGCVSDRPHRMRADPEKVRQILLNLLTNAVKFTDAGGRVRLACETDLVAGVVRVRVSDTGRGIPPGQLERIFEPFVQVDRHRTQESQQGVGLGLAISRDLARAMGGELTAESELGVGSTFTLALPAACA
ncbi:MAG: sensor protein [Gemmatimonadetes bacterium]|nr:sensor protein [Gemmatimonadota bacterium]